MDAPDSINSIAWIPLKRMASLKPMADKMPVLLCPRIESYFWSRCLFGAATNQKGQANVFGYICFSDMDPPGNIISNAWIPFKSMASLKPMADNMPVLLRQAANS